MVPTPELLTPPAAEPLTLEELKLHLRVDGEDDDALIAALGRAARQWFEVALDRQLVTARWRLTLPGFEAEIALPYPPLRLVESISYLDPAGLTQTLDPAVYDVVTTRTPGVVQIKDGQSWPATASSPAAVVITYQAGLGAPAAVPDLVKAGIQMLVAHWYEQREAVAAGAGQPVPLALESIVAATRAYRFD